MNTPRNRPRTLDRERWMREMQALLLEQAPHLAGRIDWATANYLYLDGSSPAAAAAALLITSPQPG
jgi:prepilin-type processing-associated H-X9-DG protein